MLSQPLSTPLSPHYQSLLFPSQQTYTSHKSQTPFLLPPNKALCPHSQQASSLPRLPTPSTAHQGSPHPSKDTTTFAPVLSTAIGSLAGIFRTSATLIMLFGPSYDACCNVLEPIPDKGRGLACATFITCKSEEGILPMATTSMRIGEAESPAFQDRKRGV